MWGTILQWVVSPLEVRWHSPPSDVRSCCRVVPALWAEVAYPAWGDHGVRGAPEDRGILFWSGCMEAMCVWGWILPISHFSLLFVRESCACGDTLTMWACDDQSDYHRTLKKFCCVEGCKNHLGLGQWNPINCSLRHISCWKWHSRGEILPHITFYEVEWEKYGGDDCDYASQNKCSKDDYVSPT